MSSSSYRRHRFPAAVIQKAVWLYFRFPLSLRDVEDMLCQRGIDVSYETVRRWSIGTILVGDYAELVPCRSEIAELDSDCAASDIVCNLQSQGSGGVATLQLVNSVCGLTLSTALGICGKSNRMTPRQAARYASQTALKTPSPPNSSSIVHATTCYRRS
jgi:hypothetical protein